MIFIFPWCSIDAALSALRQLEVRFRNTPTLAKVQLCRLVSVGTLLKVALANSITFYLFLLRTETRLFLVIMRKYLVFNFHPTPIMNFFSFELLCVQELLLQNNKVTEANKLVEQCITGRDMVCEWGKMDRDTSLQDVEGEKYLFLQSSVLGDEYIFFLKHRSCCVLQQVRNKNWKRFSYCNITTSTQLVTHFMWHKCVGGVADCQKHPFQPPRLFLYW